MTILDGAVGTELAQRGIATPLPGWSAHAIDEAPDVLGEIYRVYADAGATAHTANTFRTTRRVFPDDWERLTHRAVGIARESVPPEHLVLGSIAPLEDCYRPDLSPANESVDAAPREHALLARVLADAGCDAILCETFPHAGEAVAATEAALATGLPVWIALTAGPDADLMTPDQMADTACRAAGLGVEAVLVNCVPANKTLGYVRALRDAVPGSVRVGVYANAGEPDDEIGWRPHPEAPSRYAGYAEQWIDAGATIVGSCCGTGPEHTRELAHRFKA